MSWLDFCEQFNPLQKTINSSRQILQCRTITIFWFHQWRNAMEQFITLHRLFHLADTKDCFCGYEKCCGTWRKPESENVKASSVTWCRTNKINSRSSSSCRHVICLSFVCCIICDISGRERERWGDEMSDAFVRIRDRNPFKCQEALGILFYANRSRLVGSSLSIFATQCSPRTMKRFLAGLNHCQDKHAGWSDWAKIEDTKETMERSTERTNASHVCT